MGNRPQLFLLHFAKTDPMSTADDIDPREFLLTNGVLERNWLRLAAMKWGFVREKRGPFDESYVMLLGGAGTPSFRLARIVERSTAFAHVMVSLHTNGRLLLLSGYGNINEFTVDHVIPDTLAVLTEVDLRHQPFKFCNALRRIGFMNVGNAPLQFQ